MTPIDPDEPSGDPEEPTPRAPVRRRRAPTRRRRARGVDFRLLASRWSRLGAALLDSVIAIALAFLGAFVGIAARGGEFEPDRDPVIMLYVYVPPVLFFIYPQAYFLARDGQTVGKKAAGIRIVDRRDGSNPGFARTVLMRSFLPAIINAFCSLFSLIDALFIFREDKRCLHDLMAETIVLRADASSMIDASVFD